MRALPAPYARIAPRSGLAVRHRISIGAGVVDLDYRGEVSVLLVNDGDKNFNVAVGDRVAQLIIEAVSSCEATLVAELPATARGDGAFGSTGVKALAASMTRPPFVVPHSWEHIDRVLIEFCTTEDSELGKFTHPSVGCLCLRCTKDDDMTKISSVRSLLSFIAQIPDNVKVALWSGIPCTGESPLQTMNRRNRSYVAKM